MKRVALKLLLALSMLVLLLTGTSQLVMRNICRDGTSPSLPGETPRVKREALFEACVAARDREVHRQTFGTIDNPDVQREILATEKERAIRECRDKYPALKELASRAATGCGNYGDKEFP